MNLLGVQQNSASRPSLFSSIWSIQVQTQNEVNDFPLRQSFAGFNSNEIQPGSRNAISLSELPSSSLLVKTSFQRSSTCPILTMSTFEGCLLKCSKESFCGGGGGGSGEQQQEQHRGNISAVTRQQKNRNICEWLQKVSGTEPLSETSSITFVNTAADK